MLKPLRAALLTLALAGALLAAELGEAEEIADDEFMNRASYSRMASQGQSGRAEDAELAPKDEGAIRQLAQDAAARTQSVGQRGLATWYGPGFHGRKMRNGDVFDAYDSTTTAANAFPLGTWLRVTRVSSGASIEVLTTDTGAFTYPVVVDLSMAAFEKLADPDDGVIEVLVQPLRRQ